MNERLKQAAELLLAELGASKAPDPTVAELCAKYEASPEFKGMADSQTESGRIRHLVRILGHLHVSGLGLTTVDDYRNTRALEPGVKKGTTVAPATRNREVVRLVRILNWAVERELIAKNPLSGSQLEPENNERRTSIEADDIDALEEALPLFKPKMPQIAPVLWAMITTKFDSGLRGGELVRLLKTQQSEHEGMISLHARDTKSKKGRVTILSARAADAQRSMPRNRRFADSPYVFLTTRGKPYSRHIFTRMFQELAKLAGLKAADGERIWGHDLRAGFVGQQLELKTPEREIMDMSGHTTHDVFDRYVRRKKGVVARARQLLNDLHAERKAPHGTSFSVIPEHIVGKKSRIN